MMDGSKTPWRYRFRFAPIRAFVRLLRGIRPNVAVTTRSASEQSSSALSGRAGRSTVADRSQIGSQRPRTFDDEMRDLQDALVELRDAMFGPIVAFHARHVWLFPFYGGAVFAPVVGV